MLQSTLRLLKYQVEKIEFNLNENYNFQDGKIIELNQNLERNISKIDKDRFKISLKFEICPKNDDQVPFTLSISIAGIFELENWTSEENKTLATVNTVAILFPFLRSLIAVVTSNANVPPYILPVINVAAWLENVDKNE